jgi:hypothetical protein
MVFMKYLLSLLMPKFYTTLFNTCMYVHVHTYAERAYLDELLCLGLGDGLYEVPPVLADEKFLPALASLRACTPPKMRDIFNKSDPHIV